MVTWRSL